MIRHAVAAILALAVTGDAVAQTVVDQSGPRVTAAELDAARAILSTSLIDPASAQLRRLRRGSDAGVVCGELNAKNRLGGYAGFEIFIANVETGAVTGPSFAGPATPQARQAFTSIARHICGS